MIAVKRKLGIPEEVSDEKWKTFWMEYINLINNKTQDHKLTAEKIRSMVNSVLKGRGYKIHTHE